MRSRSRRLTRLGGAALLVAASITCDPKGTDYFLTEVDSPVIGALTGHVTANGTPLSAATVSVTGVEARSTTTAADGVYNFTGLPIGNYAVTATPTGFNCPVSNLLIEAHRLTTINLLCTPQVGRIDGTIRLDLQPQIAVLVTAKQGTNTVGTATSAANGTYSIPNLLPGTYTTIVTPPSNSTCNPTQRDVTVQSNLAATSNFDCTSIPGSVSGTVLFNGAGLPGVEVTMQQGGTTFKTTTTGSGGAYTITSVPPGTYSIGINPPASSNCPNNPQSVTVQANQAATANFACTSTLGAINGTVFVDMVGRSGVTVTLTQAGVTIGTTTTITGGTYSFTSLPAGNYSVTIGPPSGTACIGNPQSATVQSNQTTTLNFDCTTLPSDFAVSLNDPAPSYRHLVVGVSSETCTGMATNPAQPGASWSACPVPLLPWPSVPVGPEG